MPKRKDIKRILVIGSGPIVIGQACEFDYSGTQACKALKEEGFIVILINSNPATIMTDPEFSDRTYIEPLHAEAVARIIEAERPDALLPTLGSGVAFATGLRFVPVSAASVVANVEPVVATVLAFLILGEVMAGWQMLGGALVITGAIISSQS